MTWKSTALVSGATLLAGWLASERPAPPVPTTPRSAAARSPRTPAAESDIERQATRLQGRVQHVTEFAQPDRNLFQFRASAPARTAAASTAAAAAAAPPPPPPAAPVLPPPPRLSLSGIATNPEGDKTVRTAVLSSPGGVLLVHEGDDVLGQYRVESISDDAVQLTRTLDGSPLRLILTP
jgi:hypothetical protein